MTATPALFFFESGKTKKTFLLAFPYFSKRILRILFTLPQNDVVTVN